MLHTILGAGGSMGNALTDELLKDRNNKVRSVSRRGAAIKNTESIKADITDLNAVIESVKASDVVYLCAGLKYDIRVWNELWPKIMQNSIDGCKKAGAKFIFFDNVYMYGKVEGKMTEETPYNPVSKKGELRAKIARMLEDEFGKGNLKALIARSADLYGPYSTVSSLPYLMVFEKLLNDKKANWMANAYVPHSLTYTLDSAKALSILANDIKAFGQVWHMPTYNPAMDGKTIIKYSAELLGKNDNYMVLNRFMIRMAGIFNRTIKELVEMLYQNEFAYYFDSTKFNTAYNFSPTTYQKGIKHTLDWLKLEKK